MNKRSAIVVAAGLVVALVAGGFALSHGLVGPTPTAAAATAKTQKHQKPIVRTEKRTVKVHRKSKGGGGTVPGPVITVGGTSTSSGSTGSASSVQGDDSFENDSEGMDDGGSSGSGGHESEPGDD